jgi:hypothetical protein
MSDLQNSFRDLKKNLQALKQANLWVGQMPNMIKEFAVWWKITRNLRVLKGSWTGTLKTFIRLFKGVPRKHIPQPFDLNEAQQKSDKPSL